VDAGGFRLGFTAAVLMPRLLKAAGNRSQRDPVAGVLMRCFHVSYELKCHSHQSSVFSIQNVHLRVSEWASVYGLTSHSHLYRGHSLH